MNMNQRTDHNGHFNQRNRTYEKVGRPEQSNKQQGDTPNSRENTQTQMGARPRNPPTEGMNKRMTVRSNKTMDSTTNEGSTAQNSTDFFETAQMATSIGPRQMGMDQFIMRT